MTLRIKVTERGAVPRRLQTVYTAASNTSWSHTGRYFHMHMRDDRFTKEHARKAHYKKRKGEEPGLSKKQFFDSYTGIKQRKFGHTRPLEFTGETRRLAKTSSITTTSKGARVRYPGARKFNFRNRYSSIRMNEEFRRLIPAEKSELAVQYDKVLDKEMNADQSVSTRTI